MSAFRLVVEKGRSKGMSLRLKPTGEAVLGRDQKSALVIQDPQASRRHLRISGKLGEFVLEDLGSSNGTFVNGQRVTRAVLRPGDKVLLGETLVYFLTEVEGEGPAARKGELSGRELGGYRVGRLLGRGGMGTVYEAVQLSLERLVAFKVLAPELAADPAFVDRFVAEARAAGRLSHANIVAVFDVGQEGELRYYSMELMPGGSVEDLLRGSGGKLDLARTLGIAFDAARGLEFAEKQGLIHRDIKPDNLMLAADGTAKIIDLGIATQPAAGAEVSGSPLYIAPEHALGKPIDHRVDLYGLGVSMYQLLTGEPPFQGSSAREIVLQHIHEPPRPLAEREPSVPPDVSDLVMRLLSKDPAGRPADARQLQADLLELAHRHGLPEPLRLRLETLAANDLPPPRLAPLGGPPAPAPPRPRRRPGRLLVGLAMALGALGLVAGGGLSVFSHLARSRAAEEEELRGELARARELARRGLHGEAEATARALRERLLAAGGWPGLAEEADQLAQSSARDHTAAEERVARTRLQAAARLERQYAADPAAPGALERLEEVARQLEQLRRDHPGTPAAGEAGELAARVRAELLRLQGERREQAAREAEARERLARARDAIERLLVDRGRRDRFIRALEHVRAYEQEFGPLAEKAARALHERVREQARQAVDQALERASAEVRAQRWPEARDALADVSGLSIGDLDARVAEMLEAVEAAERSAHEQARRDGEALELARVQQALDAIEPLRAARRYGEAALRLETEGLILTREAPRRRYQLHRQRLQGAAAAVSLLAAEVRAGRPVRVRLARTGKGGQEVTLGEVDAAGRTFSYEVARGVLQDVELGDPALQPAALLRPVRRLARSPGQQLQAACLALELGLAEEARELLLGLPPGDPELRERAAELLASTEAEER